MLSDEEFSFFDNTEQLLSALSLFILKDDGPTGARLPEYLLERRTWAASTIDMRYKLSRCAFSAFILWGYRWSPLAARGLARRSDLAGLAARCLGGVKILFSCGPSNLLWAHHEGAGAPLAPEGRANATAAYYSTGLNAASRSSPASGLPQLWPYSP